MLEYLIVVDGVDLRHDVIDLPALQLAPVVAEYELACSVHLVHDAAVLAVKLQEDHPVLFVQTGLVTRKDLLLLVVLDLQLVRLLQNLEAFLLVVEHLDKVLGVEIVAFDAFELAYHLPGLVYPDLHWEEDVGEVVQLLEVAFGVGEEVPKLSQH